METAYPLRCQPFFQKYLWGGRKLATRLDKPLPCDGVWAESWEIIDHPHHQSRIVNGDKAGMTLHELIEQSPEWLLGRRLHQAGVRSLPLLLKYLDCQQDLSVQVHPDDRYASQMDPPDLGKTEAWYIIDAAPGAVLYAGLKPGVTADQLNESIQQAAVASLLHAIHPQPGDCIFIPAGTVHALGAGLLVAEIQQSSNTTFRLDDWGRLGPDGKPRPLHVQQALEVTDFCSGPRSVQKPMATNRPGRSRLVCCDKFCLDLLSEPAGSRSQQADLETGSTTKLNTGAPTSHSIAGGATFYILTTPTGGVEIVGEAFREKLSRGQSVLLPAAIGECSALLEAGAVLLEMHVPPADTSHSN